MDLDLPARLARRLKEPLPGRVAQSRFEPELGFGRHYDPPAHDARAAAVMMLLYPRSGQWHLPLVLRPATLASHAGQIGLPGGVIERGETSDQAALRELREELGIGPAGIELLGSLSPLYVYVSNFSVVPWIGWTPEPPNFCPCADEVAAILELPLEHLLDPTRLGSHVRTTGSLAFTAPSLAFGEHTIWGATAMMLGELMAVLTP